MSCLKKPIMKVYLSQLLSAWGDRMWWFAGGLFMRDMSANQSDLTLTGVFTLTLSGSVVLLGGTVGRWVDRTSRLKAAQKSLLAQNLLLVVCAITIAGAIEFKTEIQILWSYWFLLILQVTAISTSCMSRIATLANNIILQKDWIVVLAAGDSDELAKINSIFRAIDLGTHILAPLTVGLLMGFTSHTVGAIFIGSWNFISMFVEYTLLWLIYRENPALSTKVLPQKHLPTCTEKFSSHEICPQAQLKTNCACCQRLFYRCFSDWIMYFQQPVRMAGIALALLYMTVLGFDAVTTAHSNTLVPTWAMGVSQAIAAIVGMTGALSFPYLRNCLGLGKVGLCGMMLEILALVPCVYSIWLPGSEFDTSTLHLLYEPPDSNDTAKNLPKESISAFLGGVIASRFGLWITDITITQTYQEAIQENKRGMVGGVQESLNMLLDVLKSTLVILFPFPSQFGLLVLLSVAFVISGFLSYFIFYIQAYCFNSDKEEKESGN